MCLPAALAIPLALAAGGSVASYFGNQQAASAERNAASAERTRQSEFTNQQQALVDNSLSRAKDIQGKGTDDAVSARQAALSTALAGASPTQDYLPGSASANKVVGDSSAKVGAAEQAYSANRAANDAKMQGLGDSLFNTNIMLNRNSQGINQIGSFKAGSANVLPAELQAASQKGSLLRGLGSLASTIGSMWLGAAVPGAMAGAAGGAASSAFPLSNIGASMGAAGAAIPVV